MNFETNAVDSDDPTIFGTPHSEYPHLSPDELQEKVDDGYADPDNSLGDAPSVEHFCNPPDGLDREKLQYAGVVIPTVGGKDQIYVTQLWYDVKNPNSTEHQAFDELVDQGTPARSHMEILWAHWHVES